MTISGPVSAVLFDLDGTLLDTAPDMVATLNLVRAEESRPPVPYEQARAFVSSGVLGLLREAFGEIDAPERERLRGRYLEIYGERLTTGTRLFAGMVGVLAQLDGAGIPWGIVTNKPSFLTEPLLERLDLRSRCACVVSGDTVARRKPDPLPLVHALGILSANARSAVYVGDAQRDITAGRAAGVYTVAALYGYIPPGDDPTTWGADQLIGDPTELLRVLDRAAPMNHP